MHVVAVGTSRNQRARSFSVNVGDAFALGPGWGMPVKWGADIRHMRDFRFFERRYWKWTIQLYFVGSGGRDPRRLFRRPHESYQKKMVTGTMS